jgi:hypothetical protein
MKTPIPDKNPHAQALGRLGGRKGGLARAAKLSAARRLEISRNANAVRLARKAAPLSIGGEWPEEDSR